MSVCRYSFAYLIQWFATYWVQLRWPNLVITTLSFLLWHACMGYSSLNCEATQHNFIKMATFPRLELCTQALSYFWNTIICFGEQRQCRYMKWGAHEPPKGRKECPHTSSAGEARVQGWPYHCMAHVKPLIAYLVQNQNIMHTQV